MEKRVDVFYEWLLLMPSRDIYKTFVLRLRLEKYLVQGIEIKNTPSIIISTHCDACMPHALWYFVRNDDEKK